MSTYHKISLAFDEGRSTPSGPTNAPANESFQEIAGGNVTRVQHHDAQPITIGGVQLRPGQTPDATDEALAGSNTQFWLGRGSNATYASTPINENDVSDLDGVKPWRDHAERDAAFADPRYRSVWGNDFRAHVAKRVAKSGF